MQGGELGGELGAILGGPTIWALVWRVKSVCGGRASWAGVRRAARETVGIPRASMARATNPTDW